MDRSLSRRGGAARGLSLAALALCSVLLFFLLLIQTFSCDDYIYLCFLDRGPAGFAEGMRWHYASMNGRLLIHTVACAVLHFGHISVAAAGLAVLWGCLLLGLRLCGGRALPLSGAAVFFAGLLLLPAKVMQHGILWTSAFYNYVFPLLPLLTLLLALRRQRRTPRLRLTGLLLLAAAAFVSGFTTELYGLLSCALLGWELLWALLRREKRPWLPLLALAAAAGGLALIFLSPATTARAQNEVRLSLQTLLSRVTDHTALLRRCGTLLFLTAGLQAGLALFSRRKGKRLLCPLCAAGALLPGLLYFLPKQAAQYVYPALLALFAAEAFLFAYGGEDGLAKLLLAAPLSQLIMLGTGSTVYRTLIPFSLFVLLALAVCAEKSELRPAPKLAALALLTLGALALNLPTLPARLNNYRVDRQNEAGALRAAETGEMTVCMDYDLQYSYRSIFMDEVFPWYMKHYGLSEGQTRFRVTGRSRPAVFLNGQETEILAFPGDLTALYPLQTLMGRLGAEFESQQPNQCVLVWKGIRYTVSYNPDSTHYHNTVVTWTEPDGTQRRLSTHRTPCWIMDDYYLVESCFGSLWGLRFRHTDDSILIDAGP